MSVVAAVAPIVVVVIISVPTIMVVVSASAVIVIVVSPAAVSIVTVGACVVPAMVPMWVRVATPVAGVVGPASGANEAVSSPAVFVSPVCPRADAEEDSVIEVARSVESRRGAGIGRKVVIAIGADWRRSADLDVE